MATSEQTTLALRAAWQKLWGEFQAIYARYEKAKSAIDSSNMPSPPSMSELTLRNYYALEGFFLDLKGYMRSQDSNDSMLLRSSSFLSLVQAASSLTLCLNVYNRVMEQSEGTKMLVDGVFDFDARDVKTELAKAARNLELAEEVLTGSIPDLGYIGKALSKVDLLPVDRGTIEKARKRLYQFAGDVRKGKMLSGGSEKFVEDIIEGRVPTGIDESVVERIEKVRNWQENDFLVSIRQQALRGRPLTVKQMEALEKVIKYMSRFGSQSSASTVVRRFLTST